MDMRHIRLTASLIALITAAALLLPGCRAIDKAMKLTQDTGDIVESAYFVDRETGEYTAVVIIQNNEPGMVRSNSYRAKAYDENGDRIKSQSDERGDYSMLCDCWWLGNGEKTAYVHSSASNASALNDGTGVTDYYVSTPETLEWVADEGFKKMDGTLEPHGLSITDCSLNGSYDDDYGDYSVTIHNGSQKDYVYDPGTGMYMTDKIKFRFEAVAVYRDSDGKIRDGVMMSPDPSQLSDIPAGSDVTFTFYSGHVCADDLEPEYYLRISSVEGIGDDDAS